MTLLLDLKQCASFNNSYAFISKAKLLYLG